MIKAKYREADIWSDGEGFNVNNWYGWHEHTFDESILRATTDGQLFFALQQSNFLTKDATREGFDQIDWLDENTLCFWYYPAKLRTAMEAEEIPDEWPCLPECIEIVFDEVPDTNV